MGFGFSWEHFPPDVAALKEREREALCTLIKIDTEDLRAVWRVAQAAWWAAVQRHGVYWSCGYGWFHRVIESEMRRVDMVYGHESEYAPWPPQCPCGADIDDRDLLKRPCCPAGAVFSAYLVAPGPQPDLGIPGYKLSGSDNRLVTPEEITAALVRFEAARERGYQFGGEPEHEKDWNHWLRFIYCARGFGGFRVH
jgi:hypothetical protein